MASASDAQSLKSHPNTRPSWSPNSVRDARAKLPDSRLPTESLSKGARPKKKSDGHEAEDGHRHADHSGRSRAEHLFGAMDARNGPQSEWRFTVHCPECDFGRAVIHRPIPRPQRSTT